METRIQVARRWAAKCEADAIHHYRLAGAGTDPEWQRVHREQAETSARLADAMRERMKEDA